MSHELAVKQIARYLIGTKDRDLVINPKVDLNLELFADADFAGLWNVKNHDDPTSVNSRTGYVITLGGIPITWGSKLQTEIATSTIRAEYIKRALSKESTKQMKQNNFDFLPVMAKIFQKLLCEPAI